MDFLSLLRTIAALAIVLGLLGGALYVVRRYDLKLPGGMIGGLIGTQAPRRLELIERLPIDARRSIALIRRDDREHLVLLAPEGLLMLEPAISKTRSRVKSDA